MSEDSFKKIGKQLREQTYWLKGADIDIRSLLEQIRRSDRSEDSEVNLEQRLRSSARNLTNRLSSETVDKLKESLSDDAPGELKVKVDGQERSLPPGDFEAIVEFLETLRAQADDHEIELVDEQLQLVIDETNVDKALDTGLTDSLDSLHEAAKSDTKRRRVLLEAIPKAARKNCYEYIRRYIDEQGVESLRNRHPHLVKTILAHFECEDTKDKSKREECFDTLTELLEKIDEHWYQTKRDGDRVYDLSVFEEASEDAREILMTDSTYAFCLAHTQVYETKPIGDVVHQYFPEVYLEHAD